MRTRPNISIQSGSSGTPNPSTIAQSASPGWWEISKKLWTAVTSPVSVSYADGTSTQHGAKDFDFEIGDSESEAERSNIEAEVSDTEARESDIQYRLAQLRQQERRSGLSEGLHLEKQELEIRLDLLYLCKPLDSASDAEARELEIEEHRGELRRIQLRRENIHSGTNTTSQGYTQNHVDSKSQEDAQSCGSSEKHGTLKRSASVISVYGHDAGKLIAGTDSGPEHAHPKVSDADAAASFVQASPTVTRLDQQVPVRVVTSFTATGKHELTMTKGQVLTMADHYKGHVLQVLDGDSPGVSNREGWVPESHVSTELLAGGQKAHCPDLLPIPASKDHMDDANGQIFASSEMNVHEAGFQNFNQHNEGISNVTISSISVESRPPERDEGKDKPEPRWHNSGNTAGYLQNVASNSANTGCINPQQSSGWLKAGPRSETTAQPAMNHSSSSPTTRVAKPMQQDGISELCGQSVDGSHSAVPTERIPRFSPWASQWVASNLETLQSAEVSRDLYLVSPEQLDWLTLNTREHGKDALSSTGSPEANRGSHAESRSSEISSDAERSDPAANAPEAMGDVGRSYSAQPGSDPNLDLCQCRRSRFPYDECFFCWPCNGRLFCAVCWDSWPLHLPQSTYLEGGTGLCHEKCNPAVARTIAGTLHSHCDLEQQTLLHLADTDTSWFGTDRDGDNGNPIFQDFGRYATLMAINSEEQKCPRYPGLISFVGQTGAGKSSLIRLLIELYAPAGTQPQVPVVGSSLRADLPTSGDVHLYPDLNTFDTSKPLLFADCEGLDGGEREPTGARSRINDRADGTRRNLTYSFRKHIRKQYHTADREIVWADTAAKKSREYQVRHLYPRLLYTFSDVIVFVMKNPKVIENTIEQLLKWAAAALETSSNQPVLPHAIIVLNACEHTSEPDLWDVDNATVDLLHNVSRALHKHHIIRAFAKFWQQRGKQIGTIDVLLLSYYSSIRVVRVPDRTRPKLIEDQMRKLYEEIAHASEQSRTSKHKVRMLLNSDDLQPYLQYAFDHFCRDLDRPFDFVQASFANNPIPSNFGGNILKLAIDIMELWKDRLDAANILTELSFMVASCIMIDGARHRTLGPAEKVFPVYLHHCDKAVQEFCDKHWPCEYTQRNAAGTGRCVNVKAGHTKGHQLSNGKVLAFGPYQSEMPTNELREFFATGVLFNLQRLLGRLNERTAGRPHLELETAAQIHRVEVVEPLYRHLQGPKAFVSHTACYTCLMDPPEHGLPCGHVICTPCAQMFGTMRGYCLVEVSECPMHQNDAEGQFLPSWPLAIMPREAGVRILSLDGGGVRGIVELTILKQIQHHLGTRLPIQLFLDLIVGTSTGGIIALGLGTSGWSIRKCIEKFGTLCAQAFTKRKDFGLPGLGAVLSSWHNSSYETTPIEHALRSVFGSEQNLFAGSRDDVGNNTPRMMTKVAVTTATTAGTAVLLANYNRTDDNEHPPYLFRRSETPQNEIKTWEAARAASALPTYFKPFAHEPSGQVYIDGALRFHCPVEVANREQMLLWPHRAEICPDIFISIGTGHSPLKRKPNRPPLRRKQGIGFFANLRFWKETISNNMKASLNPEQTWQNFAAHRELPMYARGRYVRLNLMSHSPLPAADMVDMLPNLKADTERQFPTSEPKIIDVAKRLLATAFYFKLDQDHVVSRRSGIQTFTVTGTIECRFAPGSSESRALGSLIRKGQVSAHHENYKQHNPYFVIQAKNRETSSKQVIFTAERVDHMQDSGIFSVEAVSIELSNDREQHEILFCFADNSSSVKLYPISGFPRFFRDEVVKGTRRHILLHILFPKLICAVHHVPTADEIRKSDSSRFATIWELLMKREEQFNFAAADFLKIEDPLKLFGSVEYMNPGGTHESDLQALSMRLNPCRSTNLPETRTISTRISPRTSVRSERAAFSFSASTASAYRSSVLHTRDDVGNAGSRPCIYELAAEDVYELEETSSDPVLLERPRQRQPDLTRNSRWNPGW